MLPISLETIKTMAQRLNFVSFDTLKIENQSIQSHWYRHEDIDLYYFQREDGSFIKVHVSVLGQIIEWNPLDGTRTGLMVEEEQGGEVFETVQYDARANGQSVAQSLVVIEHASCIDAELRQELLVLLKAEDERVYGRRRKSSMGGRSSFAGLIRRLRAIFRFN